jgi:hypothetical protein
MHRKYVLKAGTYSPTLFQAFTAMMYRAAGSSTYKAIMAIL